jgi:hypothetical protein
VVSKRTTRYQVSYKEVFFKPPLLFEKMAGKEEGGVLGPELAD